MSVSRSGYYKWKYRKENPSLKDITRKSDLELIKKVHNRHKAHGYRWINSHIRKKYGVYYESGITRIKVIKRDKYICQICGKKCNPNDLRWGTLGPDFPTLDHVVPLAKGGSHTWDNVQCACGMCNSYKRDLLIV